MELTQRLDVPIEPVYARWKVWQPLWGLRPRSCAERSTLGWASGLRSAELPLLDPQVAREVGESWDRLDRTLAKRERRGESRSPSARMRQDSRWKKARRSSCGPLGSSRLSLLGRILPREWRTLWAA
jgi:hypothetical protein